MKYLRIAAAFFAVFMMISCSVFLPENGLCIYSAAADAKLKTIKSVIKYDEGCSYLTLTPANKGDSLYFTTDGSEATTESRKYKSKLKFTVSKPLNVIEVNKKGKTVATAKLKVYIRCSEPEISIVNNFDGTAFVTITSSDEKAKIHYYYGSSDEPKLYTKPLKIHAYRDNTIFAYCSRKNMKDSKVNSVNVYDVTYYQSLEYIYKAFDETNKQRAQNGLPLLALDPQLCSTCYTRALELAENYDILHSRPDGSKWYTTLSEIDYTYSFAAENIERLVEKGINPERAIENWMTSEIHRNNILNPNSELVGFSFVLAGDNCIWVQHLAKK